MFVLGTEPERQRPGTLRRHRRGSRGLEWGSVESLGGPEPVLGRGETSL